MLKIYNTKERKKVDFEPLAEKQVKIYSCGPTVYNFAHIGNLSSYLFADLLKRYLRFRGYEVIDVMNITDVDDKTIKHSQANNQPLAEFTQFYTKALFEDFKRLNIIRPKTICQATAYIGEMIKMIETLMEKGYAYKAEDGSVYFKISKFAKYGELSKLKKENIQSGASGRVNLDEYKKDDVSDFVLWKVWQEKDGDNYWQSPFGKGRPGWHIECSAMSIKNLGETFDIHTGARDLIFPHHENEIAQSEATTGKPFVKYWLHRGYLKVEGQKMSKSLGNFFVLKDILDKVPDPLAFRFLVLTNHYRLSLNFTTASLKSSEKALVKMRNFVERVENVDQKKDAEASSAVKAEIEKTRERFIGFMDDDLNTPNAVAAIFDFMTNINKLIDDNELGQADARAVLDFFREIDQVFAFIFRDAEIDGELKEKIEKLIAKRDKFRQEKNWDMADKVKEELSAMGVTLKDEKDKTVWSVGGNERIVK